jgi:hypothetical protein
MSVRFDEKTHTYWKNDVRIPSVTEILECVYHPYQLVPQDLLEIARQRGEAVDRWVTQCLREDCIAQQQKAEWERSHEYIEWPVIEAEYAGYCESFKDAFRRMRLDHIDVQQVVHEPTFGYCGTYDCHGTIIYRQKRVPVIIDWKTCALSVMHAYQVAAYAKAAQVDGAALVRLREDGCGEIRVLKGANLRAAQAGWMATLAVYRTLEGTPAWFKDLPSI